MSEENMMSDEFYDWLDQCPVQWYRNRVDEGIVGYTFVIPDSDFEEEKREVNDD